MWDLLAIAVSLAIIGPGALAPADAGILERVEMTRIRHGYGLSELGGPGVVRVAVEDCRYLGWRGVALVEETGAYPVYVVDCQQKAHEPLSSNGLVADVNVGELGHKAATLLLWPMPGGVAKGNP